MGHRKGTERKDLDNSLFGVDQCAPLKELDISCQLSTLIHHCTQSLFLRKDDAVFGTCLFVSTNQ